MHVIHGTWIPNDTDCLAVSGAQMLTSLLEANDADTLDNSARLMVEAVARFCSPTFPHTRLQKLLGTVRTADNSDIVDALLALHQTRLRGQKEQRGEDALNGAVPDTYPERGKEHQPQQPALPEHGPAPQHDREWDV